MYDALTAKFHFTVLVIKVVQAVLFNYLTHCWEIESIHHFYEPTTSFVSKGQPSDRSIWFKKTQIFSMKLRIKYHKIELLTWSSKSPELSVPFCTFCPPGANSSREDAYYLYLCKKFDFYLQDVLERH